MLKLMEGFDLDRLPIGVATGTNYSNVGVNYAAGRTGGRALRSTAVFNDSSLPNYRWFGVAAHGAGATGFAYRLENVAGGLTPSYDLFALLEGGTTHLSLRRRADNTVEVRNGAGVVLGVTPFAVDFGVWQHIDLTYTIADAGGAFVLKLNDDVVLDVTGVDTRNGGTGVIDRMQFGHHSTGSGQACLIDDWYVTDTTGAAPYNGSLGDCKIETLRPNGNGSSSAWLGSDANSVDNWQLVDDNNTTTDYVASATVGARDLYTLTNLTGVDLGDVLAVQPEVYAAKSDAGSAPGPLLVASRSAGGAVTTATAAIEAQIATGFQWFAGPIATVDPAGDPWTVARVDALEVGVEIGAP